ncbi:MAG: hypothetical protein WCP17_03050 [bacterium]
MEKMNNYRNKILMGEISGRCPFCSQSINAGDFQDDLSVQEFILSGLCPDCQDETFR